MRALLFLVVKVAISGMLLYLALGRADWSSVDKRLLDVDVAWLALLVAAAIIQVLLLALRWRLVAIRCGVALLRANAVRFSFIMMFFNQTLPSTIGGDAARIWLLGRDGAGWKAASYSVVVDRAIGLLALGTLVVACLPWTLTLVQDSVGRVALIAIAAASIGVTMTFLALGLVRPRSFDHFWATRHVAATAKIAFGILSRPRSGLNIGVQSIGSHLLTVVAAWAAGRAAAVPLEFWHALLLVLPVLLVATIPISIAGWGVRESAMMVAFSYAGLAETDGLIVSILFGAAMFVVGLVGGLVWIGSANQRREWSVGGDIRSL